MTATGEKQLNPLQIKDLVYEKLRQAIIDQTFEAGAPLREAALTERFGVSKTPIREALVRLEQDGLVEIAPYRGARAKRYTRADLHEIYAAREILEAECVRRAASARDRELVESLRKNIAKTEKAIARGRLSTAAEALDEFDEILFSQLHNSLLDDIRVRLSAHLQRLGQVGRSRERFQASVEQHTLVVDAIADGDPVRADSLLRAHLHNVLESQLPLLDDER